ncbi:hypothetical protein EDF46_3210 [Frondihabitans sp. PhB188]|uniref:hypothetical protein n=1 Tax=Frondihabitans sp. PhB188 TaxID=2485200 RepID=UPI000F4984E0|nr:hypothetical protein [Frondihabitans sp. PhB188]ROQ36667.1 hypothetical protein EDF46_3210 [Frondihabitans sp. PhB188]
MNVKLPRWLPIGLAGIFSLYHLLLAFVSLEVPRNPVPVLICMALYAAATIVALYPNKSKSLTMPVWIACLCLAVSIILPLAVASQLDPHRPGGNGYATWYVAAVGTLMVIVSTRRRHGFAWAGVGFLVVHSVVWSGTFADVASLGVVGSVSWVGISHALQVTLARASRDTREFIRAEQEAADWQAAQEAHVNERQFRLLQTGRTARPMLQRIVAAGGDLTEAERQECLNLEGAIRDEIRGRRLLSDDVRHEVMAARRRGTIVSLLDEGGIDDLEDGELARVHAALASAIRDSSADRLIIRTVAPGSEYAVTVVGLSSEDLQSSALGSSNADGEDFDDDEDDDDEDEVSLWLQIPRSSVPADAVDA